MNRVLVICPNVWDKEALAHPRLKDRLEPVFVGEELLEEPGLFKALTFDIFRYAQRLISLARSERVDAVMGTGDYPGCMLAALVAEALDLPGPRPRDVVLLSHKLYSRRIQAQLVPEHTPAFAALDPDAPRPFAPYPLFVKPVKGTMSIRACRVEGDAALARSVRFSLRERVRKRLLLRPFNQLLGRYTDGAVPAHFFIAEAPLRGDQVTVDGFIQDGKATIMGVVDSVMYPGTQSFERFEYPSRLPSAVQARMAEVVTRLMEGSGLDHSCFNVELFHDPAADALHVIEINPRMSYQFGDLYERVDGLHTYEVQLALSSGSPVPWAKGLGSERAVASFVLRRFEDARVRGVPGQAQLAAVLRAFPGATVKVLCHVGERLSDQDQDVGSYRYGIVNLGAASPELLHARFTQLKGMLPFEFESREGLHPTAPPAGTPVPEPVAPDLSRRRSA